MFLYCKRCNRPLKNERSRDIGYGPVCAEKQQLEDDEQFNQAQLTIFEVIGGETGIHRNIGRTGSYTFARSSVEQV